MNKFQVIQPSALLAPYVKQYWFLRMENAIQCLQRLVPFGCAALSFYRAYRTYSLQQDDYLPQSFFHGIATNYTDITFSGQIDFICIVFQPQGGNVFFRMPLNDISFVPVDTLNDAELYSLGQQLYDNGDNQKCVQLIEQFLLRRIHKLGKYNDKRIDSVINSIRNGETDINRLAENACLSYKQFNRIFTENIGAKPKEFLKITRFQKLHGLLQQHTGLSVDQLAYECGYYDKSHLIRDLKEFTGFTPANLIKACDSVYSGYHALFRSAFVDLS